MKLAPEDLTAIEADRKARWWRLHGFALACARLVTDHPLLDMKEGWIKCRVSAAKLAEAYDAARDPYDKDARVAIAACAFDPYDTVRMTLCAVVPTLAEPYYWALRAAGHPKVESWVEAYDFTKSKLLDGDFT